MTAISLITFRETLEASLIIGIVLAYLNVTQERRYQMFVWMGVGAGVVASLLLAWFFQVSFGGLQGRAEELYEGFAMLIAAGLIAWMVCWMFRQSRSLRSTIERKVDGHLQRNHPMGIFMLVFVSVLREGVETVIFLQGALVYYGGISHVFIGLLGIAAAVGLSYLLFRGVLSLNLHAFFLCTGILLTAFAIGLALEGIHELYEAHVFEFLLY